MGPAAPSASGYPALEALLNGDGSGWLFAGYGSASPAPAWTWQVCEGAAGTQCSAFATGNPITTSGAPPGTVFVATSSEGTEVSPLWHGNVVSTRPPGVHGPIRANALVTPVDGGWSGGWDGDGSFTQLSACRHADGTDCTSLTLTNYVPPMGRPQCPGGGAVIDPVFTGWYLRVAQAEYAPGEVSQVVPANISPSPYGQQVWSASATTAVAVVGRIAPAAGEPTVRCGAPPLPPYGNLSDPGWCMPGQTPPACAVAIISPRGEADVWCVFVACRVSMHANRAGRSVRYVTTVRGVHPVSLPRRLTRRLGHGRAHMSITVFGRRLAARRVTLA